MLLIASPKRNFLSQLLVPPIIFVLLGPILLTIVDIFLTASIYDDAFLCHFSLSTGQDDAHLPNISLFFISQLGYVIYRRVLRYYSGEEDGLGEFHIQEQRRS
jgi:hypothetical protein